MLTTTMAEKPSNSAQETGGFDSSDDEQDETVDTSPFDIHWLDLTDFGFSDCLGLSGLPGCRFQDTWRCLETDMKKLKHEGIEEVFVFCTRGELNKYRVPDLFDGYAGVDINVHHYPIPDGSTPSISSCMKMLDELRVNLLKGIKTLIHCFGGYGRTCLVAACLLLILDNEMSSEDVIEKMRQNQGPRAIQTVKQFNFVNDFRKLREEYENQCDEQSRRSVSR